MAKEFKLIVESKQTEKNESKLRINNHLIKKNLLPRILRQIIWPLNPNKLGLSGSHGPV